VDELFVAAVVARSFFTKAGREGRGTPILCFPAP
jgi:hypothetical protein